MAGDILTVKDLNVSFDKHSVVKHLSFNVVRDSTMAIIGPNGAGKSVLFRAILGLIPYKGEITWAPDVKIGYVPQKLAISKDLPLTVNEFLHFKEKEKEKITKALKCVGFLDESKHIHNDMRVINSPLGVLSGGELQRVMIAYALLGDPNVLLFDEPTSGVDITGEETVYSLINKLKADEDLTIIFISHELQVVYQHADTVLCLNKEEISFGPPMEVVNQKNLEKLYGEDISLHEHLHSH